VIALASFSAKQANKSGKYSLEGKLDQGVQEGAAQAVHGVGVGSIQEVEVHSF